MEKGRLCMNKIDIGTFEIISTTIDNSSRRIEELKNEILSCTVDIKKLVRILD